MSTKIVMPGLKVLAKGIYLGMVSKDQQKKIDLANEIRSEILPDDLESPALFSDSGFNAFAVYAHLMSVMYQDGGDFLSATNYAAKAVAVMDEYREKNPSAKVTISQIAVLHDCAWNAIAAFNQRRHDNEFTYLLARAREVNLRSFHELELSGISHPAMKAAITGTLGFIKYSTGDAASAAKLLYAAETTHFGHIFKEFSDKWPKSGVEYVPPHWDDLVKSIALAANMGEEAIDELVDELEQGLNQPKNKPSM